MALTLFLLAVVAGAAATQVPLQPPSPHRPSLFSSDLLSFIEEIRQNASIPGVSVGVVRLGEDKQPVHQLAASGRKLEEGNGYDLTPETLFGMASCSKAFLATSVGILMDDFARGKNSTTLPPSVSAFTWDTKVRDLLPEELGWSLQEPDGTLDGWTTRKASIRDVLGHVSGLPRHDFAYGPGDTAADIVRRMRVLRSAYELREKWSYNNQMYMLGAHLVAQYSGMSYADFLSTRIFGRLHMNDTTIWLSVAQRSGKLAHSWNKDGRRIPFWFNDGSVIFGAGAGGVISSAEDMVKWLAVWLNKGVDPVSNQMLFPESVYEATTTARWVAKGQPSAPLGASILGYGMGWERWSYGSVDVVEHGGGIPGFSLLTAFSPDNNIGVTVLCNADEKALAARMILKRTFDDVLGLPPTKLIYPSDKPVALSDSYAAKNTSTAPPSLSIARYAGLYTSPGYAPIALCHAESTSTYCKDVLSAFFSLGKPPSFASGLYAAFRSVWATHVRMEHAGGDAFDATFTAIFPTGYGRNTSAFGFSETGESGGPVEFDVRGGEVFGFSLVTDQAAVDARRRRFGEGASAREVADAWFEKVG
ncbi:beta-lactamase/transpeptidase-like protein [Epithele typhae]|uniref:beta-lactamase/transpeptidase-like protein n=1 Tax=Epithele typhae TaxID=378194 RepID=UPI0020086D24|nr:beta-lactamase/transpeptidase-like protein [Epithele typhae]KAH9925622.1 beta-lactamase/transpeptidase-like protein [Epithele typhae]